MLTARTAWRRNHRAPGALEPVPHPQRGSHLLEALLAITIFSIGVLGLVGALASSIRVTDDARLRSEATQLAHDLIAQMWTMSSADMEGQFVPGGAALDAWRARVAQLLPAATTVVDFAEPGLSAQSRSITVSVTWLLPGSTERHRYVTSAQIGKNP